MHKSLILLDVRSALTFMVFCVDEDDDDDDDDDEDEDIEDI